MTNSSNLIKLIDADIYMYLNNNIAIKSQSTDSDDKKEEDERNCQRHEERRKELIENCKHIRSIFENEFHPHDVDSATSYLAMNGAIKSRIKSTISDENEIGMYG